MHNFWEHEIVYREFDDSMKLNAPLYLITGKMRVLPKFQTLLNYCKTFTQWPECKSKVIKVPRMEHFYETVYFDLLVLTALLPILCAQNSDLSGIVFAHVLIK